MHPPLSPRRVLFPAGIAMALSLAGDLTLYAVLPVYAAELGIGLASLGILLSANRLVRLISNPLVGLLADHFSRRKLVLLGLTTAVLSTLLYVIAQGFWVFLLGRVLWGISWSILYIGIYCMILDVTQEHERGWSSGMLQTFYFIGLAINPVLGGILSQRLGFANALLVCAAVQAVGLLGAVLFLPDTRPTAPTGSLRISPRLAWTTAVGWIQTLSAGWFTRNREILSANYLYLLTLFIGDGIIMSTITLYLKQRYGDGITLGQAVLPIAAAGGILIALRAVVSAGAAPLAGRWSDRFGMRWMVATWGAVLAIAGCVLLALDGGFWAIITGIILASFGSGMLMAVLPVIVSSAVSSASGGQNSGLSMGLLSTSGDVGCAVAPLVSYAMLSSISLAQLYLISAVLLVSGVALIIGLRRETRIYRMDRIKEGKPQI